MAEFASKGVAGAGLGLGIAGTALGLANGGLNNLFGNTCKNNCNGDSVAMLAELLSRNRLQRNNQCNSLRLGCYEPVGTKRRTNRPFGRVARNRPKNP